MHHLIMKKIVNDKLCGLFGHTWRYKDYSNWIKEDGAPYDFKASRNCARCNQHEYYIKEWGSESEKSRYDVEKSFNSTKQMPLLLAL